MSCIIRIEGAADGTSTPHDGRYVKSWNPHTAAGTLMLTSTPDPQEAHVFADLAEAVDQWCTISNVQPIRSWDGEYNRPLTGISLTFLPA